MIKNHKKGISPVVATALILVVAVVSVVSFQGWLNQYISTQTADVEQSYESANLRIDGVQGETLYVSKGSAGNLTVNQIQIGGNDCNINNVNLTEGMNQLNVSSCVNTITSGSIEEIVMTTQDGVRSRSSSINSGY